MTADGFSGVTRILISGAGFLADAYDLFVINVVVDMMSKVPYQQPLTTGMKSTIKTMALVGAVVGQLGFGATADLIGRRKVFITTCSLVICMALLSATVQDTQTFGIYSQLALWRFFLGVGVGGEYPLSAAITSESSNDESRIKNLAMVFSMQGFGTLLCALVLVTVSQSLGTNYNAQWRIALAFGGLPMVVAFYFRWKMHESESWERKAPIGGNSGVTTYEYFRGGALYVYNVVYENRWLLTGTAGSWFIIDVVFYANGLFSGQITTSMGYGDTIAHEAIAQLILQSLSLPGYICTVLFIERIGMSPLQKTGFAATAFFFFLLAVLQPYLLNASGAYLVMYGLTFFFQNFGGNATTYIIPSVVYKTQHKATCHGISAACGKLGAILGAETLLYLTYSFCSKDDCTSKDATTEEKNSGLRVTFAVCGFISVLGLIWTELFVNNAQVRKDDELSEKIDSSLIDNDALKEAGMAKADRAVKGVSINVTNENDLY